MNLKPLILIVAFLIPSKLLSNSLDQDYCVGYLEEVYWSLDEIRQLVGLDGSLKYIGWSSYDELPPEKVFIASKIIAQDYLYLYF